MSARANPDPRATIVTTPSRGRLGSGERTRLVCARCGKHSGGIDPNARASGRLNDATARIEAEGAAALEGWRVCGGR